VSSDEFSVYWWLHVGAVVVVAEGVLDAGSYGRLRDAVVKAAAEAPRAVIVDVDRLGVRDTAALALFPAVLADITLWPGVPLLIVAANHANHRMLVRYRMARYVPVHRSLENAIAAIGDPPPRRVARAELPNGRLSARMAREFVTDWCRRWEVTGVRTADAVQVVGELVDNTMKHTYGPPTVRVELRRGMLTVAVYDDDPAPAHLLMPDPVGPEAAHGMALIASLSRVWGSNPTRSGGKVVWAVL
jgi:anti-anti-sigma regulatory factor